MAEPGEQDHWLVRPGTIRRLWIVFILLLVLSLLSELLIEPHPWFGIDGSFGFYAWFGFLSCIVLIAGSRLLGVFLKRRDQYYGG